MCVFTYMYMHRHLHARDMLVYTRYMYTYADAGMKINEHI